MFIFVFILYRWQDLSFRLMFCLIWQRPKLQQSHVVLLVLVLFVLAWGLCCVDWFLFDYSAVRLCWIADVIATFVHVVWTLVSVPVFVHSIKEDENAQCSCCNDANNHPRGAAGLPDDLWGVGSSKSGIGCKENKDTITINALSAVSYHCDNNQIYGSKWIYFPAAFVDQDPIMMSGSYFRDFANLQ